MRAPPRRRRRPSASPHDARSGAPVGEPDARSVPGPVRAVSLGRVAGPATRRPIVTRNGGGRTWTFPKGWRRLGEPRLRALRDPGGLPAPRRHPPAVGLALAPQARRPRPRRLDLVGPVAMAWWMGVLFAIGSVCFALGSFPPYATAVGATPDNITYFVGSIFFTTASFLQYMEVASTPTDLVEPHRNGFGSLLRIRHRRIDWWAAGIQLVGTVWFNRTTLERAARRAGRVAGPPPDLAARRAGLHLLPRLELAGLGRGVPRALRLAAVPHLVVDHRAEPRRAPSPSACRPSPPTSPRAASCSAWP